jgi:hypothetical protein
MQKKRYKPLFDRVYLAIWIPLMLFMLVMTAFSFSEPVALWIMIPTDLFVLYFFVSPLFGFVELKDSSVFIKFGFFMTREIPYAKIRGLKKERKFYSESMTSLKNALEHVNIKYNNFDVVTVSVKDNDDFLRELLERI